MTISTESQELKKYYLQKLTLDTEQLNQLNIMRNEGYSFRTGAGETEGVKVYSSKEMLDLFGSIIIPLDTQVIGINSQITSKQNQVLSLGLEANSIGCGGTQTIGFTTVTVYEDRVKYTGYDYSGSNPFQETNGTINTSNVGMGTYNYVTQVAIGTYYGPIDTCNILLFLGCTSNQECQEFSNKIVDLNAEINSLRTTRDNLNDSINVLKAERIRYELQDYAYKKSKQTIEGDIANSQLMINILDSY